MKLRTLGILVLAATAIGSAALVVRAGVRRADVLVLVMDTTRADRCSVYGYGRPTTPRLEALAPEFDVYEDAWSPSSWTMPAHAALFTGVRPDRLGLVDAGARALSPDVPTLAEILAGRGYSTACFTCNGWIAPHSGLTRGFGRVDALWSQPGRRSARAAHDEALAWMAAERTAGRRFFAFVNDVEPHAPWDPPVEWREKLVSPDLPREVVDRTMRRFGVENLAVAAGLAQVSAETRRAMSDLYDAEVASVDAEVGSLIERMRSHGLLAGTLVVILSDHGEGLVDHGVPEHGIDVHREVLRVPLLVRGPSARPGRRIRDVVRVEDVFASVLKAAGAPLPAGIDGRPLSEPLGDRLAIAASSTREEWCDDLERLHGPGTGSLLRRAHRSVFDGRLHLILDRDGVAQLYDVVEDPKELTNLATDRPEDTARLRAALEAVQ